VLAEPPPPAHTLLQTALDTYSREHHTLPARDRASMGAGRLRPPRAGPTATEALTGLILGQ
jgi:hypothetical protein